MALWTYSRSFAVPDEEPTNLSSKVTGIFWGYDIHARHFDTKQSALWSDGIDFFIDMTGSAPGGNTWKRQTGTRKRAMSRTRTTVLPLGHLLLSSAIIAGTTALDPAIAGSLDLNMQ